MKTELLIHNHRRASYEQITVKGENEGFQMSIESVAIKDWQCVPELQQHCYSGSTHEMTREELQQLHVEIGELLNQTDQSGESG